MLVLDFPKYGEWCKLSEERYVEVVSKATAYRDKALKLMTAYWVSHNELQLEMARENVQQLRTVMMEIMVNADDEVADKMSKRATFLFELAEAVSGLL